MLTEERIQYQDDYRESNLLKTSITGIEWMSAHEFPLSNHLISYSGHGKLKSKDIKA